MNGLQGFDNVMRNLNKEIEGIKGRTKKGVILAASQVMRDALINAPHDLGNLKGSKQMNHGMTSSGPISEIGFTASYALATHENVDPKVRWKQGGPKYLENAIKTNRSKIVEIIGKHAEVSP